MTEIYVSTDVEADGPIPGPHSMLSFASAAFRPDKTCVSTFSANLALLRATGHPDTMAFWRSHPDAWPPGASATRPRRWPLRALGSMRQASRFRGYPAAFDFMFVYWYLIKFAGRSPFSHSALDIKTMAMVMLGKDYRASTKKHMPRRWFDDVPHTHVALDAAIAQGRLFCNVPAECRSKRR